MDRTSQIFINIINELEINGKENLTIDEIREKLNEANNISYSNIYVKFDFIINKITDTKTSNEYKDCVFYMSKDILLFEHNKLNNNVFINDEKFGCYFYDENEQEYDDNKYYIRKLLSKYLQSEIELVNVIKEKYCLKLEDHLKTIN